MNHFSLPSYFSVPAAEPPSTTTGGVPPSNSTASPPASPAFVGTNDGTQQSKRPAPLTECVSDQTSMEYTTMQHTQRRGGLEAWKI
ncbi:hypothetical protein SORBI_3010G046801 [Sorghum bicolor]|uniref:Uncharacterized protein n=1 Tax=Sorghum bicolor TaxID=4558 RepID=A0A1W0VRI0_SORBI|nr:hypothetical protein SORBI_3010G046801 [Sorghum bicolor]